MFGLDACPRSILYPNRSSSRPASMTGGMTPYKNINIPVIFQLRHSPFRIPVLPTGPSVSLSLFLQLRWAKLRDSRLWRTGHSYNTRPSMPPPHPSTLGLHSKILAPCNKFISDTNGWFEMHVRRPRTVSLARYHDLRVWRVN